MLTPFILHCFRKWLQHISLSKNGMFVPKEMKVQVLYGFAPSFMYHNLISY